MSYAVVGIGMPCKTATGNTFTMQPVVAKAYATSNKNDDFSLTNQIVIERRFRRSKTFSLIFLNYYRTWNYFMRICVWVCERIFFRKKCFNEPRAHTQHSQECFYSFHNIIVMFPAILPLSLSSFFSLIDYTENVSVFP